MQFSTLNAYPSAVPVPKEIFADVLNAAFADVLHALPPGSFNHDTRGKQVLPGFFKLLQHTLRCAPDAAEFCALRGVMWRWCSARPAGRAERG